MAASVHRTGPTGLPHPLGLVLEAGSCYRVGRIDGDERVYRVSRIRRALR